MTATNAQVRIMMRERQKGKSQEQAAASANVRSRKTVAKYEGLERLPSELKQRAQLPHAAGSFCGALVPGRGHAGDNAGTGSQGACSAGCASSIRAVTRKGRCALSSAG